MEILLGNLSLIIPSIVIKPHHTSGPEEEMRLLILNITVYSGTTASQKKMECISPTCGNKAVGTRT